MSNPLVVGLEFRRERSSLLHCVSPLDRFFLNCRACPVFGVTTTFGGEVLLPLWLLIKRVNVEQWEKRALESA
jgi:hypothetical protein